MAKTKSTNAQRKNNPASTGLIDANLGTVQTLENCKNVVEFVRQADLQANGEEIEMGRFLILGLVHEALSHAQDEFAKLKSMSANPVEVGAHA